MFQNANLWEAGILLIGVAFVIGAIYLAMVLKKLSKTLEDANAIIVDNRKAIELIMNEVETITRNSSMVVEDVQETVGSLKKSVVDVEKTVKTSKNYVLSPILKSVTYAQAAMRVFGRKSKKKK
ncbi:DUF948 domain-containing protein [Alkalibacter rhizosphaerae]|uniref:DUF948 domain-containing protein n=1 Tax=Alkalibacter rhizosphaerae TaxID=2815577 RepID=A0A974XFY3_9FIRM|nr:DUF948 domain-containing protein [Alkalibacter rhizosphaerae]QSX07910.1 DUF948 domain-containing protein [Alkalibacter rhizosphaerae]